MKYNAPINSEELFVTAEKLQLYQQLIFQLNKDFALANESLDIDMMCPVDELILQLNEKIYKLIHSKFAEYLNLLYIIDVAEDEIKKLDGSDLILLSQQVTFIILKREWQKVWYRNQY